MSILKFTGCFTLGLVMLLSFPIGAVQAGPCELPDFGSAIFNNPLIIDNPYLPLNPSLPLVLGKTFEYRPVPNEDNVVNKMIVTNCFKEITVESKTIQCLVVYDVETVNDIITEETWDWYAQDDDGNIWYCGEDTTAYLDDGTISKEGSWEAGVDGALPGYLILAEPRPGVCYQQESAEDAQDRAKVLRLNAKVSVEYGNYKKCLETKEWTPLDPGVIEQKYYARDVGLVLIKELKGKTVRVELVDIYTSNSSEWVCPSP